MSTTFRAFIVLIIIGAMAGPARAGEPRAALTADAEIDPTAFALGGYSLHVGVGDGRLRVDLGAFAMDVPELMHGNDGFDASFHGFGAKLQLFRSRGRTGAFAGAGMSLLEWQVRRAGTDLARNDTELALDLHAGWRFALPARLYATIWLAVGASLGRDELMVGGEHFERTAVTVFPAVHLGYRF